MEKIYHANTNQRKVRIAKLISDRANFKAQKVIGDFKKALPNYKGVNSLKRDNIS